MAVAALTTSTEHVPDARALRCRPEIVQLALLPADTTLKVKAPLPDPPREYSLIDLPTVLVTLVFDTVMGNWVARLNVKANGAEVALT
jgi:hypothetical protein